MHTLIVGDKTQDGSVIILDEDRLCYSVKSVSNGAIGVRTISKNLLEEWVEEYGKNPNENVAAVRKKLVGKSDVDRYEYGYSSTLAKMAKMILGQESIVHLSMEEQRQKEFFDWMVSTGKAPNYASDVSRSYLPTLSNDAKPPSTSMWHGLREYLYGAKPQKRIYEVVSYEDLLNHYSGIDKIFGLDSSPGTFDAKRFKACWDWAHNPDNHNSVSAAWNLYKQFMKWRDEHPQAQPQAAPANTIVPQELVISKQMSDAKPTKYDEGKRKPLSFTPNSTDDKLLLRLLAALRAKPFVILAGHSGTGKSRYVKKLAYMTCNMTELRGEGQLPGNYLILQVKPNWHDSTDLLGFRNALESNQYQKTALIEFIFKAYHFKDTPFFLCLDEMNLAPVEQYFAEFLSAMESKEAVPLNDITEAEDNLYDLGCEWLDARDYLKNHKFSIPKNLFIVGTVNMDETTNQFSRKVLDRAFTIEMTDVDFRNFGKVEEPSYEDTIEEDKIQALLKDEEIIKKLDPEDITDEAPLVKIQKALEPTAFAIAYRFANEYTLLKRAIKVFDPNDEMKLDALDQAVLMKILPRIAGERDYIEQVYYGKNKNDGLINALEGKTASLAKINSILERAKDMNTQYITFWP